MTIPVQHLSSVEQTALFPLYYRALESQRPDGLLQDRKAVELINQIDYDFAKLKIQSFVQVAVLLRARQFDFVVQNGERIEEIAQVSMGDLVGDTRKRELRALTQAARRLHPERALVITETEEGTETLPFGTVSFVPLQKWLLAPEGAGSADRSPS